MLLLKEHLLKIIQHAVLTMHLFTRLITLENLGVAWSISRTKSKLHKTTTFDAIDAENHHFQVFFFFAQYYHSWGLVCGITLGPT
jgi:hypothetical protein